MKAFGIGILVGIALVWLAVYLYFKTGMAPVATDAGPMPFERWYAHVALAAAIKQGAPRNAPFQASDADLQTAAHLYREHCAVCHGLPDGLKTAIASGEYPKPPLLLHGKGVTDDPPGETFWKVKHGIRMTGMPSFGDALSDRQIWDISLMLGNADKLSSDVQTILNQPYKPDTGL
jgi:mono/diheme cytochrome c family protein